MSRRPRRLDDASQQSYNYNYNTQPINADEGEYTYYSGTGGNRANTPQYLSQSYPTDPFYVEPPYHTEFYHRSSSNPEASTLPTMSHNPGPQGPIIPWREGDPIQIQFHPDDQVPYVQLTREQAADTDLVLSLRKQGYGIIFDATDEDIEAMTHASSSRAP